MGAYEELRDDVTTHYQAVVTDHQRMSTQEGPWGAAVVPPVSVSGSKPAWLGEHARQGMAAGAGAGAVVGLVLMTALADDSSAAASMAGGFAIVALVVAYLTIAGFGTVEFSIGSGGDSAREQGDDQADRGGETGADGRIRSRSPGGA